MPQFNTPSVPIPAPLTRLEEFTKAAMQGLCANPNVTKIDGDKVTFADAIAVEIAQATLAALDKAQAPKSDLGIAKVMDKTITRDPRELVQALGEMLSLVDMFPNLETLAFARPVINNARATLAKWEATR